MFPMLIPYPNYTHRIPNVSPRLIFEGSNIRKHIWISVQGAYVQGAYIRGLILRNLQHFIISSIEGSTNLLCSERGNGKDTVETKSVKSANKKRANIGKDDEPYSRLCQWYTKSLPV